VNGLESDLTRKIKEFKGKLVRRVVAGFEKKMERDLSNNFAEEVSELEAKKGFTSMRVEKSALFRISRHLRDVHGFDHCSLITSVDWIEHLELVYHLWSYENKSAAQIRVKVPKDDPEVDSVTPLWGGANWHEREAYDMMGITFKGHPDPRRILLPQEYEYFPLRKDFEMETE